MHLKIILFEIYFSFALHLLFIPNIRCLCGQAQRAQEIAPGAVLSRAPFASSHTEPRPSLKAHTIADFAIEPYASPRPNSCGLPMTLGRILKFHLSWAAVLRKRKLRRRGI